MRRLWIILKFGGGVGAALTAWFVLLLVVFGLTFGYRWVIAEPTGRLEARERIQSGDFRIAAYDHFFDLCSSVQADEGRLDALGSEAEEAEGDRAGQVRASITAVQSARVEKIREYNADAAKDYTIGQFRDSGLPYRLDPEREETQCAV